MGLTNPTDRERRWALVALWALYVVGTVGYVLAGSLTSAVDAPTADALWTVLPTFAVLVAATVTVTRDPEQSTAATE